MKVETDIITIITASLVGWAAILVIIYVKTFKTDIIVSTSNILLCLTSHCPIIFSIRQFVNNYNITLWDQRKKDINYWLNFVNISSPPVQILILQNIITYISDHSGPAPMSTRWTVLCLDMNYVLSMYLNRKFSYIKNVKLCANMLVKNISTSDILYEVGMIVFFYFYKKSLN